MAINTANTAAHAVGTTVELVEQILLQMPADAIIKSIRVCRQWRDMIQRSESKKFQEAMFMVAEKSLGDPDLERWYLDTTLIDANYRRYAESGCQQDIELPSAFVCIGELSPEEVAYLVNRRETGRAYPQDDSDLRQNTVTPVRINPILEDLDGWVEFAGHGRLARLPHKRLRLDQGHNTQESWNKMHLTQPPTAIDASLAYNDFYCGAVHCKYGNEGHPRIERPGNTTLGVFADELMKAVRAIGEGEMDDWDWAHSGFTIHNIAVPDDKGRDEVRENTLEVKREYAEKMEAIWRAEEETQERILEQHLFLSQP